MDNKQIAVELLKLASKLVESGRAKTTPPELKQLFDLVDKKQFSIQRSPMGPNSWEIIPKIVDEPEMTLGIEKGTDGTWFVQVLGQGMPPNGKEAVLVRRIAKGGLPAVIQQWPQVAEALIGHAYRCCT